MAPYRIRKRSSKPRKNSSSAAQTASISTNVGNEREMVSAVRRLHTGSVSSGSNQEHRIFRGAQSPRRRACPVRNTQRIKVAEYPIIARETAQGYLPRGRQFASA